MNDLLLMAVEHSHQDLPDVIGCLAFAEVRHLLDTVEQFPSAEIFGHEVIAVAVLVQFVELDDIGVVKILEDVHLRKKTLFFLLN
jgi:hypothetical protein